MSISEPNKQFQSSTNPLWEFIPKTCIALLASIAIPILALFLVLVIVFRLIMIFSEPQSAETGLAEIVPVIFGVPFFIASYGVVIAIPCAGFFGIPSILIGWRLGLIRWWTCVLAGFFVSTIPGGLFLWGSYSGGSSSANGVQYWIKGVPTSAGLIQFTILVLIIGVLGALGGYSFWIVWRLFSRHGASESGNS